MNQDEEAQLESRLDQAQRGCYEHARAVLEMISDPGHRHHEAIVQAAGELSDALHGSLTPNAVIDAVKCRIEQLIDQATQEYANL